MTWGEPCGNPGEVYHYNDTGYILLGEIIENIYGKPLGIALNELLCFERLGINTTWIEKQQASRSALFPQVHQYNGDVDFNTIDATWDLYGGGGLVSTVGDLARFTRALFTHQIYQSPDTLKIMLSTVENAQGGSIAYGRLQVAGVYRMGIESAYNGRVYSHTGYLGTYAGYVSSHDLTLSLSFSEHNTERRKALVESIYTLFSIAP